MAGIKRLPIHEISGTTNLPGGTYAHHERQRNSPVSDQLERIRKKIRKDLQNRKKGRKNDILITYC